MFAAVIAQQLSGNYDCFRELTGSSTTIVMVVMKAEVSQK